MVGPVASRAYGAIWIRGPAQRGLFNALAGGGALAAPYAFATTDPNVGVAKVFDDRVDQLAAMSGSRNIVHASVQFNDIGGLVEGASQGEGLGNKFLAGIREVDAIVFVLRAFPDDDVPGPTDPLEHLGVVETELALADLETAEKQLDKVARIARTDKSRAPDAALLERVVATLSEGTPIYKSDLTDDERNELKPYYFLTNKPVLAVVTIGEDQLDEADVIATPVRAALGGAQVVAACVQLEAEAAQLDLDERAEMLEGLGLGEGALPRFIRAAYELMGLRTYLTTGEKETRAWTFRAGSTAPQAAGVIHTDFERGFIRAETIDWADLVEAGSWHAAREKGLVRSEGKDYVVRDGDVMEFRFNV